MSALTAIPSVITSIVASFTKSPTHVTDIVTSFATYGKTMRAMLNELPEAEREVQAAMTALETAVMQGVNAFAKLDPKAAAAVQKATSTLIEHAKAAPVAAVKKS